MIPRLFVACLAFGLIGCGFTPSDTPPRPNVILILADDLGYSDLGCYGGEIETPNLDRLADGGLRFGQFYNTAKCGPTRVSLLSGLYYQTGGPGIERGITIGQAMRAAGYTTLAVGKWHVRGNVNPIHRGFDRYFGHLSGATDYFRGNDTFRLDDEPFDVPPTDFYTTDAFVDRAIQFVEEARAENPERPFFLYLAFNAPHSPLQAQPEDIDRYRGSYLEGWDRIRQRRYRRQTEIGLIQSEWSLSARSDEVPAWDELTREEQRLEDVRMAVYAGMVDRIDQQVGRLMAKLRQWQVEDNTLVMFLSDNGANPFDPRRVGSIGERGSQWSLGAAWANASNTPFRLYKRNQHNGGIATPFIAYWPNTIHSPGEIVDDPAHVIDIMPTLNEISGWNYSTGLAGYEAPPLPGRSLLPLFRGDAPQPRGPLFFQFLDHRAILEGHWKLVSAYDGPWELYRMDIDRTESHDLASEETEQVRLMADQWEKWWQRRPNELWRSRNRAAPSYIRLTPEALASETRSN